MSGNRGDGAARDRDARSASIVSPFGQNYASQRERRSVALAEVLSADPQQESSGPASPVIGDGSSDREEWWHDPTRPVLAGSLPSLELVVLLAQVPLALSLSGFRQWRKQIQLASDYGMALLSALAPSSSFGAESQTDQNRVIEETQAYLRRASTLSLQEARLLQRELERIGDGMRELIEQPPPDAGFARRWRAKR